MYGTSVSGNNADLPVPSPAILRRCPPTGFAGLRMWRQALTAFDRAKAEGLPLTSATYTHVINVMSKGGR